jgi:hypothetical protein
MRFVHERRIGNPRASVHRQFLSALELHIGAQRNQMQPLTPTDSHSIKTLSK